jgi:hypothetical protein
MVEILQSLKVDIEVDKKMKAPWCDHPILGDGEDVRISGEDVINKLAEIGGEKIKHLEDKDEHQ